MATCLYMYLFVSHYSVCTGLLYTGCSIFSSVRYRGMQLMPTMLIGFNLISCFINTCIKSEPSNYSIKSCNILSNSPQLIMFYLAPFSHKSIYPYMYSYFVFIFLMIIIVGNIVNNHPIQSLALILCGNKVIFLTCLMRRQSWYKLVSLDKLELVSLYVLHDIIFVHFYLCFLKVTTQAVLTLKHINAMFVSHTSIIIFSKCAVFTYCILYYVCIVSSQYKAQDYHRLIGDG